MGFIHERLIIMILLLSLLLSLFVSVLLLFCLCYFVVIVLPYVPFVVVVITPRGECFLDHGFELQPFKTLTPQFPKTPNPQCPTPPKPPNPTACCRLAPAVPRPSPPGTARHGTGGPTPGPPGLLPHLTQPLRPPGHHVGASPAQALWHGPAVVCAARPQKVGQAAKPKHARVV